MGKKIYLLVIIFLLPTINPRAHGTVLRYFQTGERYEYRVHLLESAMEETESDFGPYTMEPFPLKITQSRGIDYLLKGKKINICSLPSNKERESLLLSVKIPILNGLLGYRVCLVRKEMIKPFSRIKNLEDLRKYRAGFGSQWADFKILKDNGLPVVGAVKYENLFAMLSKKRFDYFPRGVNEVWAELEFRKKSHPDLRIVDSFLLYYPYPVYFYVNKKDIGLAKRIRKGLEILMKTGKFQKIFLKYNGDSIRKADIRNKAIIYLENNSLSKNIILPDRLFILNRK